MSDLCPLCRGAGALLTSQGSLEWWACFPCGGSGVRIQYGKYPDQTRNLNPTPEAKVAMIIWGEEYAAQRGGSMDFWGRLSADRKKRCRLVIEEMKRADTDS